MSKVTDERNAHPLAEWRATLKDDGTCWQCERALGEGPEGCLTCAVKRTEDRAKGETS